MARVPAAAHANGSASPRASATASIIGPSLRASPSADAPPAKKSPFPSLAEQIAGLGQRRRKLTTGIETLDTDTRGGIPLGTIVTLQGPPGGGKTGLAAQLAEHFARAGVQVRVVAADEPAAGWLVRFGQHNRIARDDLEAGEPDAKAKLAEAIGQLPLVVVDTDLSDTTVEQVAETMTEPGVIFVDLLQTALVAGSLDADSPKARVDLMMAAAKRLANRDGHLVILLSEVSRGAYRSRNARDHVNPLSAGKESGSIESRSSAVYHLTNVPKGDGDVDVIVAKGRFHREKTPFRLMLDRDLATFTEIARPDADDDAPTPSKKGAEGALDDVKQRVLDAVAKNPAQLTSANRIHAAIGGTRKLVMRAVRELIDDGVMPPLGSVTTALTAVARRGDPNA